MIRAAIDPGSRWIACTITRDDGPSSPCNWVDAKCFDIGREIKHDPPLIRYRLPRVVIPWAPGPPEPYEVHVERVLTEVEARAAATEIVSYLLSHHVGELAIEHVRHIHGNGAAGTGLLKSSSVYTRVVDRLEQFGIPVRYELAPTWRARLNPLVKASLQAAGKPIKGVLITRSTGAVLDPVFAAHVPGWPGVSRWTAEEAGHIRDSTGLALACGLPVLETSRKAPAGPRKPRERRGGKRGPRGTRVRSKMPPEKADAYRATDRARWARTVGAKMVDVRAASGCDCRPEGAPKKGRHKRTCPAHKARTVLA